MANIANCVTNLLSRTWGRQTSLINLSFLSHGTWHLATLLHIAPYWWKFLVFPTQNIFRLIYRVKNSLSCVLISTMESRRRKTPWTEIEGGWGMWLRGKTYSFAYAKLWVQSPALKERKGRRKGRKEGRKKIFLAWLQKPVSKDCYGSLGLLAGLC